jgi:hypothetical protein
VAYSVFSVSRGSRGVMVFRPRQCLAARIENDSPGPDTMFSEVDMRHED